jgi:ABC-type Fe3+-siderophore transport system permease subunit
MKALGIALLVCGAILQMLVYGGPLANHFQAEYVKTPEAKANAAAIWSASSKAERDRLADERQQAFDRHERPAVILGIIGTCISLLLGYFAASRGAQSPIWYYVLSGIGPGLLIFYGWKQLRPPKQV